MKLEQLEKEIALLQKEKEKELLRIEVEKLKKTVVEETVIIHKETHQYPNPWQPNYPVYPWDDNRTTC